MASELLVINPRHRRRRKAKRAVARRRSTHRRRRRLTASNPRRTRRVRRVSARRHSRLRMHRNPRIGMGSITSGLKTGMGVGLGIVVTNFATGLVVKKVAALPKSLTEGLGLTALKIGIGAIAVPMLLRAVKQHKLAGNVAIGAWAAVAVDLYGAYVQPQLAAAGLGEYEPGSLQDYQPASLQGDESSVDLSGTLYEGGVYD